MEDSNMTKKIIHVWAEGETENNINYADYITMIPKDSRELVSKSFRDLQAGFHGKPVNSVRKQVWRFDCLTEQQVQQLYVEAIEEKVIANKSMYFNIKTFSLGSQDTKARKYYIGSGTSFAPFSNSNGGLLYKGEIHWIEKDGTFITDAIPDLND